MNAPRTPESYSAVSARAVVPWVAAALVAVLALVKVVAQLQAGPLWDSYAYLANAAAIVGRGIGYSEPWRPPLLSLVTAPLLAIPALGERAVQIADAIVSISGLLAFYLLLRRRFDCSLSSLRQ